MPVVVIEEAQVRAGRRNLVSRHRFLLAGAASVVAVAAAAAVAIYARGNSEPETRAYVGAWSSIDRDGSNQTMEVSRGTDTGSYDLTLKDDDAQTACRGGPVTGEAAGATAVGNVLSVTITLTCASGPKLEFFYPLTYRAADETLVDRTGVVWSRKERGTPDASTPSP